MDRNRPSHIRSSRLIEDIGLSPSSSPRKLSPKSAGLLPLGSDSRQDYDWCKHLAKFLKASTLRLEVPAMFLYSKTNRLYFALCTNAVGEVNIAQGMAAWSVFFPQTQEVVFPYLALDRTGMKRLERVQDAHYYATHTLDTFALVRLDFELKEFVTVSWSAKSGIYVTYEEEEVKKPEQMRSSSTFQHDLGRFFYAGRLKKSSFSPMLPYNSTLAGRLMARPKVKSPKARRSIGSQSADSMVAAVTKFMQRGIEAVSCLTMQVMESTQGRWMLLNVLEVQWATNPALPVVTLPSLKRIPEIPQEPKSAVVRSSLKSRTLSTPLQRAPYIDLAEIQQTTMRMYAAFTQKRQHHRSLTVVEVPGSSAVDVEKMREITLKFEKQGAALKSQKELLDDSRKLQHAASHNPGQMHSLISQAYSACSKDPLLQKYFRFPPQSPMISHLSGLFERAVTSMHHTGLAKKVAATHKAMGITEDEFERFVEIFTQTVRKELCESDVELLTRQMTRYKSEVVSS